MELNFATPQGWECPKCGHVYSPSVAMCSFCPGNTVSATGTSEVTLWATHFAGLPEKYQPKAGKLE